MRPLEFTTRLSGRHIGVKLSPRAQGDGMVRYEAQVTWALASGGLGGTYILPGLTKAQVKDIGESLVLDEDGDRMWETADGSVSLWRFTSAEMSTMGRCRFKVELRYDVSPGAMLAVDLDDVTAIELSQAIHDWIGGL